MPKLRNYENVYMIASNLAIIIYKIVYAISQKKSVRFLNYTVDIFSFMTLFLKTIYDIFRENVT